MNALLQSTYLDLGDLPVYYVKLGGGGNSIRGGLMQKWLLSESAIISSSQVWIGARRIEKHGECRIVASIRHHCASRCFGVH